MFKILSEASIVGGKALKKYYKTKLQITEKTLSNDFVTNADLESQKNIIAKIKKLMLREGFKENEVGFIGEEGGLNKNAKNLFIIDPLDGTTNFINGLERFSISIAYAKNKQLIAGIIYNPSTEEFYFGEKNKGAFKINGKQKKRLMIKEKNIIDSIVIYNRSLTLKLKDQVSKIIDKITPYIRSASKSRGAVLNLMMIAENKAQLLINSRIFIWDFAAAKVILEEAGAIITDWQGKEIKLNFSNPEKPLQSFSGNKNIIKKTVSILKND